MYYFSFVTVQVTQEQDPYIQGYCPVEVRKGTIMNNSIQYLSFDHLNVQHNRI